MKKYGIATISCLAFINVFAQNEKRLNILFIEADQHRYDCTGFSGKGLVKTPNIDKLAEEGVVFENSYSCIPTSCPARQCLLSGQWPEKHRGLWNYDITLPITPFEGPTWTEKLSQEDVRMGYVGKWHVSDRKSPKDFGFQDMSIRQSYARAIDGYFDMFGYSHKRTESPVTYLNSRPFWNYIKTQGILISGNFNNDVARKLESIFNNGVRFWHGDYIGNYSLHNAPQGG